MATSWFGGISLGLASEFRDFITKGNVIDLAVAVVMGVAFNSVVTAFVSDIITPLIGVAGHYDFSALNYTINGSAFQVGLFINQLISFIIMASVVFFLVVRPVHKPYDSKKKPAGTKTCPECLSAIPEKATRCAFCTSKLKA